MSHRIIQVGSDWPETPELRWIQVADGGAVQDERGERPPASWQGRSSATQLWLPAARVLLGTVRLPTRSASKVRDILPFAVEDQLAVDPEQVHVALGPELPNGESVVAVVDRAWLRELLDRLAGFGIQPRTAVPDVLVLPNLDPQRWTVLWDGREGSLRQAEALGQPLDVGTVDRPPLGLVHAIEEARTSGAAPLGLDIRATGKPLPDIASWSRVLGLPVVLHQGDPFLEAARKTGPAPLNLLQGSLMPARGNAGWWPALRPALIILGIMLLVQVLGTIGQWWMLKREANQLRAEMASTFRQTFPNAALVDPPLQMQRQLADLRQRAGMAEAGDFLVLLSRVAPVLAGSNEVEVRALRYGNDVLEADVRAPGPGQTGALVSALGANGVRVQAGPEQAGDGGVSTRLQIQEAGGS